MKELESIYGLLVMAKLAGLLPGVKDTDKVRNRQVAKSRIVLILHILNISLAKKLFHNSSFVVADTALQLIPTRCA